MITWDAGTAVVNSLSHSSGLSESQGQPLLLFTRFKTRKEAGGPRAAGQGVPEVGAARIWGQQAGPAEGTAGNEEEKRGETGAGREWREGRPEQGATRGCGQHRLGRSQRAGPAVTSPLPSESAATCCRLPRGAPTRLLAPADLPPCTQGALPAARPGGHSPLHTRFQQDSLTRTS